MTRTAALLFAVASVAGCGPSQPPPEPAPPAGLEAPELGLRLTALPAGFRLVRRQEGRVAFDAPAGAVGGTAAIEVRAVGASPYNLVAEARAYGEQAAAQGGKFFGGNELVTPFGPAYTARALVDRGLVEERAVFLLHPDGSERLVLLRLRYPPGDAEGTRARMLQALDLVGALEPLPAAAP
jgi:hypothetical protein